MVMKASVEDDDSGWELGMPDKMEKNNTNWIDITQDFEEACSGEWYCLYLTQVQTPEEWTALIFPVFPVVLV